MELFLVQLVYLRKTTCWWSSSTTQLNFIGQSINAEGVGGSNPGVAVTITVAPPGNENEILL